MGMVCARIDIIISAMAKSCLSPKEIAEKSGVSVGQIYRARRGYLIRIEIMGKICRALGISPEDVIDYDRLEQRGGK